MDSNFYDACANDSNIGQDDMLECVAKKASAAHDDVVHSMNVFFLIYAASLVFFMQAGFAMICAGSVRQKNIQNTMLKNLLDSCGCALAYFSVGYGFSFGGDSTGKTFIGNGNFFLMDSDGSDDLCSFLFQFAFAATSATIVAGTMAERCQMKAYLLYSLFLTGFVYPVVSHWVWSKNGFLSFSSEDPLWGVGMIDFAGSGVVHVTGGVTALIATKILGPRKGRFYDEISGEKLRVPKAMQGHSPSLLMLGTFVLWFGWFGFNAGSAIDVNAELRPKIMALAVVNTTLSAATGGVTALVTNLIITERRTGDAVFNILYAMNGCISGLVAVTGCGAVIDPWASVVIGVVAGWIYLFSSNLLVRWCIDDAVDAIPVHLSNGIWGILATSLFASRDGVGGLLNDADPQHIGLLYSLGEGSSDATLLGCNVFGLVFIIGWVSSLMLPFFLGLSYFGMLRSDPLQEMVGLDVSYGSGFERHLPGCVDENEEKKRIYRLRKSKNNSSTDNFNSLEADRYSEDESA